MDPFRSPRRSGEALARSLDLAALQAARSLRLRATRLTRVRVFAELYRWGQETSADEAHRFFAAFDVTCDDDMLSAFFDGLLAELARRQGIAGDGT